jgi:hypothetical protein
MARFFSWRLSVALLAVVMVAAPAAAAGHRFVSPMSGGEEVPPVPTRATGVATYKLSGDGTELSFRLIVANIQNVTQAHIHCGAAGVNGPVVAFLYGFELIPGRTQGVLSEGTLSAAHVIPRPDSPACPGGVANFDDLLAKMRSGDTYTNVHTTQFPGGEIRGQIR